MTRLGEGLQYCQYDGCRVVIRDTSDTCAPHAELYERAQNKAEAISKMRGKLYRVSDTMDNDLHELLTCIVDFLEDV